MPRQSECLPDASREHRRPVANRHDAVDRCLTTRSTHRLDRPRLVVEAHRNRLVPPGIVDAIAPIAGKHQTNTQRIGRFSERPDLIPRRRRNQKDSLLCHFHTYELLNLLLTSHFSLLTFTRCPLVRRSSTTAR